MRSIRARVHLEPNRRGRKGYVCKKVFTVSKFIYFNLKKLASKRRRRRRGARTLDIVIKYRNPILPLSTKALVYPKGLKTYKRTIPLWHPADPRFPFVDFWHQLSKRALILQVIKTCEKVPRRVFASAQIIGLEANNFETCHASKWIVKPPVLLDEDGENLDSEEHSNMSESALNIELMEDVQKYMPHVDLTSEYTYGKIPLKKTEKPPVVKTKNMVKPKNPVDKVKKRLHLSNLVVFHKRLKGDRDDKKMRQTQIEEFFKPRPVRGQSLIESGATPRGAIKKQRESK